MSDESRENAVAGAAQILEHLTRQDSQYERSTGRRVFSEAIRAWPGSLDRMWWKWFDEAGKSVGLRCKHIVCTVENALRIARDGARLVLYCNGPTAEWVAVLGSSGRRFEIARGHEISLQERVSRSKLRQLLKSAATDGRVRCVIVEQLDVHLPAADGGKTTPLRRLTNLLNPEWADIWIVLVYAFVAGLLMLATPIAVESLVNTVAFGRFLQPVVVLALVLLTFLGFLAGARALQTFVVEIIQRRLFARVASDLAYRIPRVDVESTDGHYLPELVNRFFDIVTVQKVSAQLLLDGVALVLSTVVGMAVLAFYHPWLLGFDVVLLASICFVILVLGRGAVASAVRESKHKYHMAAWLEDIARCSTTFRNSGGADFALERADRLISQYLTARKSHFRVLMRQILFALGLQALASTILLGLGGWLVISDQLTLGQLVAAELIVTAIVGAFAKLGKHMESFYDLLASVDKLGRLFDLPIERHDGILTTDRQEPISVELNAVCYGWPEGQAAIAPVSAVIPKGTSLAVVGASGSGKSTLLDLIYGTRDPIAGHLTVAGFDPRDCRPDALRKRVSLVRGNEVFQATVEENVHLHREDVSAADVRRALKDVCLIEPVLRLDKGYSTMLTSGGSPLTENQCRLLTIARAIAGRPGLLMIDGVLDALPDAELEPILQFLVAPGHPWTLVVATGRDAIARRCAHRLDLDPPQISETSSNDALVSEVTK